MTGRVRFLLLNPFGIPVRSFDTPDALEAHIVDRFGAMTVDAMAGHRGVRRQYPGGEA